ncbi:sensor histidine kinase [Roseivirga misakiensis]|uniref:Signal transduction histidine kinase internal region domain-containing protein n=1 Tax=Roseivirga misakiensis TaxID=1563681 RepID=A0A1E5SZ39_9BACT|nr:histidine kinase [Roseivirga misakiensis]OEK04380.1 hypothetical protein BFP71_12930 [Roseivirga misakiensis]
MKLKEVHVRIIGIPILAFIMALIFGAADDQTVYEKYFESFLYTAFYWNSACWMFFYFRRRFPLMSNTPKRLFLASVSLIGLLLIGDFVISMYIKGNVTNPADYSLLHSVPSLIAGIVVGLIYEAVYFFEQWKNTIRINEALKNQQIRTQFEVLQNQMSPHFLFNSLNTLSALIPEDPDKAQKFTDSLSDVYRYILQNKEKDLVTLKEELDFAKTYLYLLKMRYPENLSANFKVDPKHERKYVAPLSIQMLVENAIKHNIVSKKNPLHIEVYIDAEMRLVVRNNLQPKKAIEKSTKTGLANIKSRYAFFGLEEIGIHEDENSFVVSLPLIEVENRAERRLEFA